MRDCIITDASIELQNGAGDGAYSLLDVHGTPDDIGKAVADALREGDMCQGPTNAIIEDCDGELYLTMRIKFAKHPVSADA